MSTTANPMTPEQWKAMVMSADIAHGNNMAVAGEAAVWLWTGRWPGAHNPSVYLHAFADQGCLRIGSPAQRWKNVTSSPRHTYIEFECTDCPGNTVVIERRRNRPRTGEVAVGSSILRVVLPEVLLRQYQVEADEGSPLHASQAEAVAFLQEHLRQHPPVPVLQPHRRASSAAAALVF